MAGRVLSCEEVLALVPQQRPFRFVDRILEIDDKHVVGRYRFRPDESFYAGHFPGHPITPGVILIEAMAQVGVVAFGYYLYALDTSDDPSGLLAVFSDCQAEFMLPVKPGEEVTIRAEKIFWRSRKLKSRVELTLADGRAAATAVVAGMGVPRAAL